MKGLGERRREHVEGNLLEGVKSDSCVKAFENIINLQFKVHLKQ